MAERKRLDTWGEIALYLNCSIRTAQRWEKTKNLPIHRLTGTSKERVFTFTDEIDDWLSNGVNNCTKKRDRKTIFKIIKQLLPYFLLSVLIITIFFINSHHITSTSINLKLKISNNILIAFKDKNNILWKVKFKNYIVTANEYTNKFTFPKSEYLSPLNRLKLSHKNRPLIFVITGNNENRLSPWILHCLNDSGRELWNFKPGEKLTFDKYTYNDIWHLHYLLRDINHDGKKEIIVVSHHYIFFPSKITVLNQDGKILGQFINSGWIRDVCFSDINKDGKDDLVCVGSNDSYNRGALFVLDYNHLYGCSPRLGIARFTNTKHNTSGLIYYLLFPRSIFSLKLMARDAIISISKDENNFVLKTFVTSKYIPEVASMYFVLSPNLKLLSVEADNSFEFLHETLLQHGLLDHHYSPKKLIEKIGPVFYWNGQKFVNHYTMNLEWAKRNFSLNTNN